MTDFAAARRAMVDCQVRPADVTRYAIIEAMLAVPRERFVPRGLRDVAYAEAEVEIAPGRHLLRPRSIAKLLEAARIGPADLVLELCPGTGYATALIARMAEAVVAVEPDPTLCRQAQAMMDELEVMNAAVASGDPTGGDAMHGPYDVAFVSGAVETLPRSLLEQLKDGGRLVAIFAEGALGQARVLTRAGGAISERTIFDAPAPVLPGFERSATFVF